MQSQRFFIGNLPPGIAEKDVSKAFKDYGDITGIVIKEKENLVDPGNVKRLAFVTLNLYDGDVDFCLRKLNSKPINGEYIRVSVAKESFLERLNREREENAKANGSSKPPSSASTVQERDIQPLNKSKMLFNTKEDNNEETSENWFKSDVQITKKNASYSMSNAKSERFFIGNLPSGITEKDINKAFKDYGDVTGIVLKQKENLVDPGNVKTLAFVTLNLFDGDVDFCLRKLNSRPINGEYVRVSVAKESFLERLNREREDNAKGSAKLDENVSMAPERDVVPQNKSKKYFNTEEDDNEKTFDDDILITKKKASSSMRNGKIVIEGTNSAPLHVIGKQKEVKQLSEKSFDSDKKRKESVTKKKNQYQLQKSLIQKSLSSVDTSKTKKIVFGDDDDDNNDNTPSTANPLFQDSDEENDTFANDFALKSEYEGSHGAELMKLQSRMNLDPRFKIDHKFVEKIDDEPVQNENSERDWQYGILEQVVGSKVSNVTHPKGHEKKKLKMLRYDPSKDNEDEFLIKRPEVQPMEVEAENVPVEKNEVSKEVFYMVSDNLTNSLKSRGDGFSLLSMFGTAPDEDEISTERQSKEKILISKNDKNDTLNPFTYDSSESENENEGIPQKTKEDVSKNVENSKGNSKTQTKLFVESFFIPRNDVRLKEGKLFFRSNARSGNTENYDEIKDKLKSIINTKINKTKRQFKGPFKKKSIRGR